MLEKNKYDDLEDLVYRLELTRNEIIDILDLRYIPLSRTGYSLPLGINESKDIDFMSQFWLPNDVEVKISIDDVRLGSSLSINRTTKFT